MCQCQGLHVKRLFVRFVTCTGSEPHVCVVKASRGSKSCTNRRIRATGGARGWCHVCLARSGLLVLCSTRLKFTGRFSGWPGGGKCLTAALQSEDTHPHMALSAKSPLFLYNYTKTLVDVSVA